jgi:hypothetical protein
LYPIGENFQFQLRDRPVLNNFVRFKYQFILKVIEFVADGEIGIIDCWYSTYSEESVETELKGQRKTFVSRIKDFDRTLSGEDSLAFNIHYAIEIMHFAIAFFIAADSKRHLGHLLPLPLLMHNDKFFCRHAFCCRRPQEQLAHPEKWYSGLVGVERFNGAAGSYRSAR